MTRLLYTTGSGVFEEDLNYVLPPLGDNEIKVKAVKTGVCRSDIAMMMGKFGPLPMNMQGHEGLGQVIEVGKKVDKSIVGNYVATRGEPAFADEYNVREREYVVVPGSGAEYILEPVACGVNCIMQPMKQELLKKFVDPRICIVGSGFLAKIIYKTLGILYPHWHNISVLGRANQDYWSNNGIDLQFDFEGEYDIIIDLKDIPRTFNVDCIKPQGLVIMASTKQGGIKLDNFLWKAVTMVFPSPRADTFYVSMVKARDWIHEGFIDTTNFWTRGYDRDTEWRKAFEDGKDRPKGYGRGFIEWR